MQSNDIRVSWLTWAINLAIKLLWVPVCTTDFDPHRRRLLRLPSQDKVANVTADHVNAMHHDTITYTITLAT